MKRVAAGCYMLGRLKGSTKVFFRQAFNIGLFVIMAIILLLRRTGLFRQAGTTDTGSGAGRLPTYKQTEIRPRTLDMLFGAAAIAAILAAPVALYPEFLMSVICFALFACAFRLLIGDVGFLSFGHAAVFGRGESISDCHKEEEEGPGVWISAICFLFLAPRESYGMIFTR